MIKDFKSYFDVIPGLSDHTLGTTAPVVAVSLGAKIIEKHFIYDKSIGGPDASFSLDQKEFTEMVKAIREAEKMIIVVRERNCVNLSNSRTDKQESISEIGGKFVKDNLEKIRKKGLLKDVMIVSFEMLEQFREHTLRQIFRFIGVDEDNYNYNNENESFKTDWFSVSLKVKDVNKKYIKDK